MTASVLIVDSDPARAAAHGAALRRLGITSTVSGAVRACDFDAIVLDATDDLSFDGVRRTAPDLPIVIACDDRSADRLASSLDSANVAFLHLPCSDADYALALASLRVLAPLPATAAEGDAGYALRLAALGEEIARIARAIEPPTARHDAPPVPDAPLAFDPCAVRTVLKARRLRDSLFAEGTFADPAWDMLFDLTASRGEGRRGVGDQPRHRRRGAADDGAPPPEGDGRRWAGRAAARSRDGRRTYIDLSEDAFGRMRAWVAGAAKTL